MIITVINGQNHKGSTYNIGKILVGNLGENEVHEFFLPRDLNHFCTGCCSCIRVIGIERKHRDFGHGRLSHA